MGWQSTFGGKFPKGKRKHIRRLKAKARRLRSQAADARAGEMGVAYAADLAAQRVATAKRLMIGGRDPGSSGSFWDDDFDYDPDDDFGDPDDDG
jgi:hypothetical protein